MSPIQAICLVVFVGAALSIFQLAVLYGSRAHARKVFWRSLRSAEEKGRLDDFMRRFNERMSIGDSLEDGIRRWGTAGIHRIYREAVIR